MSAKKAVRVIILLALISIISYSALGVKDVAYIVNTPRITNSEVLNVFSQLNLSVDIIKDSDLPRTSLAAYRLVFIDDMRLRNTGKTAIYRYPSVVMNKYYGKEWGITDNDGISQLSSNTPLSVQLTGNGPRQVYTTALVGTSYLYYYYLEDGNKANGTSIARTYVGENENDFGDAIMYINKGTRLKNGQNAGGDICFYGIAKTPYWTSNARNLFIDCVKSVAIQCNNNSECNDFNSKTQDICLSPGQINSTCIHTPITCIVDSDCGQDTFTGSPFCNGASGNDVYQNFLNLTCNNPGTIDSFCSNTTTLVLKQTCSLGCNNGACLGDVAPPVISLVSPANNSALSNSSVSFVFNISDASGLANASLIIDGIVKTTVTGLINGGMNVITSVITPGDHTWKIVGTDIFNNIGSSETRAFSVVSIICNSNSNCTGGGIVNNYCSGNNVYSNVSSPLCLNPGMQNSQCSFSYNQILNKTCSYGCNNGVCNPPPVCLQNSDCGNKTSYLTCNGNIVVNVTNTPTCNNGNCTNVITNFSVQTCSYGCVNGVCINPVINCTIDSNCNDGNARTVDQCINPNTSASYCRQTEVNCLSNNDCGFTGFTGQETCSSNNVFKYFQNSTCNNPGTLQSSCSITLSPVLIQNCSDNNSLTFDSCVVMNNSAICQHKLICNFNSDCPSGGIVNNYCSGNNVYSNVSSPLCLNPGMQNSQCSFSYNQVLNKTCSYGCSNGICNPPVCTQNSNCGNKTSYLTCSGNVVINVTNTPTCINGNCTNVITNFSVQTCSYGCVNGSCNINDNDVILVLSKNMNAHAETYAGKRYSYLVRYSDIFNNLYNGANPHQCNSTNKVLVLSKLTNAHAEINSLNSYAVDICYGNLVCSARQTCNPDEKCVVTISKNTNAHLSLCNSALPYSTKICCKS
ncbi:Ig-like domain-containing protein [Candidatus Pacearchaeota archaeon]|nr:Ig-like domain-containing protein [Candidatus Pacearchaeota archaeon]